MLGAPALHAQAPLRGAVAAHAPLQEPITLNGEQLRGGEAREVDMVVRALWLSLVHFSLVPALTPHADRVTLVDHVCAATTDTPIVHLEPERALGHSLLMVACEIYGDANEFLGPLFNPPAAVRVGVWGTVFAAEAAQLT